MGLVNHDLPKCATPFIDPLTNFVYLRFHGPEGGYKGSYSSGLLQEYASYIHEWLCNGKTVYTFFNNTMGNALKNIIEINGLVEQYCLNFYLSIRL